MLCARKILLFCLIVSVWAPASADVTKLDTKLVAVFKNGLGFWLRSGDARLEDGWGSTDTVPQAAFGTLWMATTAKSAYVDQMTAHYEEAEKTRDARTIEELLKENIGNRVKIRRANLPDVEGKIVAVSDGGGEAVLQVSTGSGKVTFFPKSQIADLQFPDGGFKKELSYKESQKRIKFHLTGASGEAPVSMAYLAKGVTWIPSYLVNIEDEKKARISFKSELVNDSEDLKEVDIVFVVGYPNFAFSDMLSPMSLQQNVADFVRMLSNGPADRAREQLGMLSNSMAGYGYAGTIALPIIDAGYESAVGIPGQAEADLFLYSESGVTLKRGERAAYTIFSDTVDYEHVYEWQAGDMSGVDPWGNRKQQDEKVQEPVWHSLRLSNSTKYPWTTAPAMTVSGSSPLAQDTITYTPKGAKTNLKITIATDVVATKKEEEISRQHNIELNKTSFDEVTVKGELNVTNYKSEDVKLVVTKELVGSALEAGSDGKVTKASRGLTGVNPRSVIEWEITLESGKSTKLEYSYSTLVRI